MTTAAAPPAMHTTRVQLPKSMKPLAIIDDDSLKEIATQCNSILRERAKKLSPTLWEDYRGNELMKRALVVAAISGQNLLLLGPRDAAPENGVLLADQIGANAFVVHTPSREDMRTVHGDRAFEKWRKSRAVQRVSRLCPMMVEVPPRNARDLLGKYKGTSLQQAGEQLQRGRKNLPQVVVPAACDLEEGARTLLNQAINELFGFTERLVAEAIITASAIAALDQSTSIQMIHVAEAIQYRNLVTL